MLLFFLSVMPHFSILYVISVLTSMVNAFSQHHVVSQNFFSSLASSCQTALNWKLRYLSSNIDMWICPSEDCHFSVWVLWQQNFVACTSTALLPTPDPTNPRQMYALWRCFYPSDLCNGHQHSSHTAEEISSTIRQPEDERADNSTLRSTCPPPISLCTGCDLTACLTPSVSMHVTVQKVIADVYFKISSGT